MRVVLFILLSFTVASSAFAQTCFDLFQARETVGVLESGNTVTVTLQKDMLEEVVGERWLSGESRELIFVGYSREGGDVGNAYLFVDAQLTVHYFRASEININGTSPYNYELAQAASLPGIVRQSQGVGSCLACSNVMAANQRNFREDLPEYQLTGKQTEENQTVKSLSHQSREFDFLVSLYNRNWPNGFSEGAKPHDSLLQTVALMRAHNANIKAANAQTLSRTATLTEEAAAPVASDLAGIKSTPKVEIFLNHLRAGGVAIMSGLIMKPESRKITSWRAGAQVNVPFSSLQPFGSKWSRIFKNMKSSWSRSQVLVEIVEDIQKGKYPDEAMVQAARFALSPNSGFSAHAIAAVGIIKEGPLKDHVIAINPWGFVEVYSSNDIKNGLSFSLLQ